MYAYFISIKYRYYKLFNFQNKLKSSQKDKVKKFMTFTQTSECVAIFCLAKNDWKLEQASDNFFQNPHEYETVKINTQLGFIVDKRKLEAMYNRYRGNILTFFFHFVISFLKFYKLNFSI